MTEPYAPDMNKLKAELGRTPPPSLIKNSPEDFAPKKHSDHANEAHIAQRIKGVMRDNADWDRLTENQREMLDLIATNMARIVAGRDYWQELADHAKQGHEE